MNQLVNENGAVDHGAPNVDAPRQGHGAHIEPSRKPMPKVDIDLNQAASIQLATASSRSSGAASISATITGTACTWFLVGVASS
jgi:hypothetical protein